ncbi:MULTISPECIES: DUF6660 family protein [Autumnicola]|uniref:DUF6660 family protein n=2 Tax=Autumnicola TaxID=3160927 RepID=A0ABU3CXT3_9FLAO|nr:MULTISPECIES: DUF6660 family protein [unclassified Zunongwangia]MDT0651183.1 DUF6660 family protein [Zunongwangia sp. F297]MDT0675581.1 DUF6660 family protein [Zunongwangia sp. F117]
MKIFTIILSLYFLALNFAPCSDTVPDSDDTQLEFSQTTDADHNDSDLCSPFCQCHCCHVHTIDFELMTFEPFQDPISNMILTSFQHHGKDFHTSLFQPPRHNSVFIG